MSIPILSSSVNKKSAFCTSSDGEIQPKKVVVLGNMETSVPDLVIERPEPSKKAVNKRAIEEAIGRRRLRSIFKKALAGNNKFKGIHGCGVWPKSSTDRVKMLLREVDGQTSGRAFHTNTQTCKSHFACACCRTRQSVKNAFRLLCVIQNSGYSIMMWTATIQHNLESSAETLISDLKVASRKFGQGRSFKEFQEKTNYIGSIKSFDYMFSTVNGHHPHQHNLLAFDLPLSQLHDIRPTVEARIADTYEKHLKKLGYLVNKHTTQISISTDIAQMCEYVVKEAVSSYSVAAEATYASKTGKQPTSGNIFWLLERYAGAEAFGFAKKAAFYRAKINEICEAVKGRQMLRIPPSLTQFAEPTAEQLHDQRQHMQFDRLIVVYENSGYAKLHALNLEETVLETANAGSQAAVFAQLDELEIEHDKEFDYEAVNIDAQQTFDELKAESVEDIESALKAKKQASQANILRKKKKQPRVIVSPSPAVPIPPEIKAAAYKQLSTKKEHLKQFDDMKLCAIF